MRTILRWMVFLALPAGVGAQPLTQAQIDSGWVTLWDGQTLKGFYTQFGNTIDTNPNPQTGTFFVRTSDTSIAAKGNPIGILTTKKKYSHYRLRLWEKFDKTNNSGQNAGILYHVQPGSPLLFGLYPRSIEMQGQARGMGELWTIGNVWITTWVRSTSGTPQYSPTGTVMSVGNAQGRQCLGSSNPYRDGQWNVMDLTVRGRDSSQHTVNGTVVLRTRNLRWSQQDSPTDTANPLRDGQISIQSEGEPVAYKHIMIMELDPVTGKPINAKPVPIHFQARRNAPTLSFIGPGSPRGVNGRIITDAIHGRGPTGEIRRNK